MSKNLNQSNILICGSSRVGKSTLINAICQEKLIQSNQSLNSHTKTINQYSFKSSFGNINHETIFWDTPGIESWNSDDVHNYIISLIDKTQPICMIYCASPGSFALLDHLFSIITECYQRNIFCALVCTNMWSGSNRQIVIKDFCHVLNIVHPDIKSYTEDGIIYYDNFALVTMVNSMEYIDEDFGVRKESSGINELIFGISKCLQRENMFLWLRTVSRNKSFWTTMASKLSDLLQVPYDKFNNFLQSADNFFDSVFDFSEDYRSLPANDDQTEDHLFHDAEMIEIPKKSDEKKLRFILKSEETTVQLSNALITLGAKNLNVVPSKTTDDLKHTITVEFNDVEYIKAMYNLCQIITQNEVDCTIVDQSTDDE